MLSTRDQELVLARDRARRPSRLVSANQAPAGEQGDGQGDRVRQPGPPRPDGRPEDRRVCVFVIPYSEDYTLALDFSTWLIKRLRDRGMHVNVETRRATNGLALLLTDAGPRRAR